MSPGAWIIGHPRFRPVWIAGRLLTRLPFPDPGTATPTELGRAVPWYPAVGGLLGLLFAGAAALLGPTGLAAPPGVAAALVLGFWVWVTGALHLDGLADTADAWVGGLGSRERTLAIMKDPACGPVGVVVLVVVLLAKFAALEALIGTGSTWGLLWVPMLARAQLPLLLIGMPYARSAGMAAAPARAAPAAASFLVAVLVAGAVVMAMGWRGVLLVVLGLLLFWQFRLALLRRLGGFTGDTAGALVELTEMLALMVLTPGF
jgi:adenosylcobinamide-GDP ribazoletransferase